MQPGATIQIIQDAQDEKSLWVTQVSLASMYTQWNLQESLSNG